MDLELSEDKERFDWDEFERWRKSHTEVHLCVDEFEDLFTLNSEEVQTQFVELLGRLVQELDIHVLSVVRDDFIQSL